MSGCLTMLWGWPSNSSFSYPLTSMNIGLQYRMRPLRSVVDTRVWPLGNAYSCVLIGRLTRMGTLLKECLVTPEPGNTATDEPSTSYVLFS